MHFLQHYIENEIQTLDTTSTIIFHNEQDSNIRKRKREVPVKDKLKDSLYHIMLEYKEQQITLNFILDTFNHDTDFNSESNLTYDIKRLFGLIFYDRIKHKYSMCKIQDHLSTCYHNIMFDIRRHKTIERKVSVVSLLKKHCSESQQLDIVWSAFYTQKSSLYDIMLLFNRNIKVYYMFVLYLLKHLPSEEKQILAARLIRVIQDTCPNIMILSDELFFD